MTKAEKKFEKLYKQMKALCEQEDWGDPFSYARAKEILLAIKLGHKVSSTLSGADGIDKDGECEYKSTTTSTIKASYTGISVQPTWKEQQKYIKEDKIGKYQNHYHARFDGGEIVECYRLSGQDVLSILLPKLKGKYPAAKNKKDPRLSAIITKKEIIEYGTRII